MEKTFSSLESRSNAVQWGLWIIRGNHDIVSRKKLLLNVIFKCCEHPKWKIHSLDLHCIVVEPEISDKTKGICVSKYY